MSKAFTKEDDEAAEALPDRPISPNRNLVTAAGLAQIQSHLERLGQEQATATRAGDSMALARVARDLRYWRARHATAELMPAPPDADEVRFGSTVLIARPDGRRQTWRIVGEDEAEPARGLLSYASPVARALLGGRVGDVVQAGPAEAEILEIW